MTRTGPVPTPAPEADLIAAIIRSTTPLPGAACRGKPELFDPAGDREPPELVAERHTQALTLCRSCTELTSCRQWLHRLHDRDRPQGVVAGLVNDPQKKETEVA